jgi:hypothetical protein
MASPTTEKREKIDQMTQKLGRLVRTDTGLELVEKLDEIVQRKKRLEKEKQNVADVEY